MSEAKFDAAKSETLNRRSARVVQLLRRQTTRRSLDGACKHAGRWRLPGGEEYLPTRQRRTGFRILGGDHGAAPLQWRHLHKESSEGQGGTVRRLVLCW